jgi:hypothetical protein
MPNSPCEGTQLVPNRKSINPILKIAGVPFENI